MPLFIWVAVQKKYIQKCTVSCINIHHDVKDLVNHGRERNITFLRHKKILNLCLRWHILKSCRFVAEVTLKNTFRLETDKLPKNNHTYKSSTVPRDNVKYSYSSMPNISSIANLTTKRSWVMTNRNHQNLLVTVETSLPCPLNGNCLQQNMIYCSKVIPRNQFTNKNHPHYIGLTESSFKERLYKHKNSFKYENKRNVTELSNFIWDQKSKNFITRIEYSR